MRMIIGAIKFLALRNIFLRQFLKFVEIAHRLVSSSYRILKFPLVWAANAGGGTKQRLPQALFKLAETENQYQKAQKLHHRNSEISLRRFKSEGHSADRLIAHSRLARFSQLTAQLLMEKMKVVLHIHGEAQSNVYTSQCATSPPLDYEQRIKSQ
jgi:hypothetical protein